MTTSTPDLVVLYEHPEWQKPLFAALERRGVSYAPLQHRQRGIQQSRCAGGAPLFQSGQSKRIRSRPCPRGAACARLHAIVGASRRSRTERRRRLRARTEQERPGDAAADARYRHAVLDHVQRCQRAASTGTGDLRWPALLKPDQGGSGARIQVVSSWEEIEAVFTDDPDVWLPDNLFLLQEFLPHDPDQGIVRMEFLGGELLYAMRVKTHGRFNLCPSPVCNPESGEGACALPAEQAVAAPPVEFYPYLDVPREAVEIGKRIVQAARLDVGGIEYLETDDGRRVFYDINANSNLRPSVAAALGFDPFDRVVDFLVQQLVRA